MQREREQRDIRWPTRAEAALEQGEVVHLEVGVCKVGRPAWWRFASGSDAAPGQRNVRAERPIFEGEACFTQSSSQIGLQRSQLRQVAVEADPQDAGRSFCSEAACFTEPEGAAWGRLRRGGANVLQNVEVFFGLLAEKRESDVQQRRVRPAIVGVFSTA